MNDETALLAAILANPADDTVRLVYADWLEEHGQPERAEFIRVQITLSRLSADAVKCTTVSAAWCPVCGDCCCRNREESMADHDCPLHSPTSKHSEYERLMGRQKELLETRHGTRRLGYLWAEPAFNLTRITFRRGFLEVIECSPSDWLTKGDEIVARHPIKQVTLTTWPDGEEWIPSVSAAGERGYKHHRWPKIWFTVDPSIETTRLAEFGPGLVWEEEANTISVEDGLVPIGAEHPPDISQPIAFLPREGWHITITPDVHDDVFSVRQPRHLPHTIPAGPVFTAEISITFRVADFPYPLPTDFIGARFGPVTTIIDRGQRYHCEGILRDFAFSIDTGEVTFTAMVSHATVVADE